MQSIQCQFHDKAYNRSILDIYSQVRVPYPFPTSLSMIVNLVNVTF